MSKAPARKSKPLSRRSKPQASRSASPGRKAVALRAEAGDAPKTNLVFGLNFNLHGTAVPVTTDDIANAKENGIEFTLPQRVDLGTLTDFTSWLHDTFGVDVPQASDLPSPLDAIIGKLSTLDVAVDQFHIKVPGTSTPDASTLYTLAMTAQWPAGQGIPLIPGVLTIDGAVFGATNETPAS